MCCPENKPRLIVITGPTAVGKTELAIELALHLNGEIISADSRLFYRGMDIGTAKPSLEDRKKVNHYLIDIADPRETWSLALFQQAAREIIRKVNQNHRLPFLVGGTGQFIRAVIEEWSVPLAEPDYKMRKVLEEWASEIGAEGLHSRLAVLDPIAASMIDLRNMRRTIRALEVCLKTGIRFSEQRKKYSSPYHLLIMGLNRNRDELFARVDNRVEYMLNHGFIEEVRGLMNQGYSMNLPAFSAIGYREIASYLRGECTLDEAITLIKRGTRQFIRRQANWFKKKDPNIHWFNVGRDTINEMENFIIDYYRLEREVK